MRIGLFIDTENFGGAESVVITLADFLSRCGHDPVIYHFGNADLTDACSAGGYEGRIVDDRFLYKKTYRLPLFALRFGRTLMRDRIDVLHSHLFGPIFAGALSARVAGIPHLGTLHDVYIVQERKIRATMLRIAHALGTTLICVSDQMRDYYSSVTKIRDDALKVVKNGIDISAYPAQQLRRRRTSPIQLIMVGRLDAIKRHDLLFDAISALNQKADIGITIVGEGPERNNLEQLATNRGIIERVEFLGQRRDIPRLLVQADIFILVSDSEGMSLSLIEALAAGLPAIVTDVGNNGELVTDGWNGYVVAPGNVDALASRIKLLADDDESRIAFGLRSRQRAEQTLDANRTLSAYLELYEQAGT